jgi:hypothetical protein
MCSKIVSFARGARGLQWLFDIFMSVAAVMIDMGVLVVARSAVFCILSSFRTQFWLTVVIALFLYSMVFVCSILCAMLRVSFVVLQLVVMSIFISSRCDMDNSCIPV